MKGSHVDIHSLFPEFVPHSLHSNQDRRSEVENRLLVTQTGTGKYPKLSLLFNGIGYKISHEQSSFLLGGQWQAAKSMRTALQSHYLVAWEYSSLYIRFSHCK